ncbi:MAG: helix-turn-helix domain-containing protein [Clostridiaceae bacterium]|jgi:mannose-6-phosphate isomerase-like protein (cupin superfamily)/DNA-binding XRE family transcriptional regulator|nr:helix-turn-helix domain-containing protein [Clostridiaceae bacterium]
MSEQIRMIAARIRELREIAGYTTEQVASMVNIPSEVYAGYESGNQDIPIGFLNEFANRFHVDLTELLTGKSPKLTHFSLVRKGKGISVQRRTPYQYQSLAYNFVNKKAEPFLVTVLPNKEASVSMNSHPGQEFNYVLKGTLMIVIDGKEFVLNAGDSLYFDASLPHGMKAMESEPAEFLAIIF